MASEPPMLWSGSLLWLDDSLEDHGDSHDYRAAWYFWNAYLQAEDEAGRAALAKES